MFFYTSYACQLYYWLRARECYYNFGADTLNYCANDAVCLQDSFFIAAGNTSSYPITPICAYLSRLDYNLNVQKRKALYFPGMYNKLQGTHTIIKSGNAYLLTGVENNYTINSRTQVDQPYIFWFNKDLDSINFVKYVDTVQSREPACIMQDKQKNIIICGQITSKTLNYVAWEKGWNPDSTSLWIAKYDSIGNLLWEKDVLPHVHPTSDAQKIILAHDSLSYIVAGAGYESRIGTIDYIRSYIAKIDTAGNVIWLKWFIDKYPNLWSHIDIISLKNGDYAFQSNYIDSIEYTTYSIDATYTDFSYGKFDDSGNILWNKHFLEQPYHTNQGERIAEAANGDLLLLGSTIWDFQWPILVRTDSNGKVKEYREYLYKNTLLSDQEIYTLNVTPGKQVLMSGILSNGSYPGILDTGGTYSWFVLTDTFDCVTGGCQAGDTVWQDTTTAVRNVTNTEAAISIYPNPTQDMIYVQGSNLPIDSRIALLDISGRQLYLHTMADKLQIDMRDMAPGLYLLQLWTNGALTKVYKVSKE